MKRQITIRDVAEKTGFSFQTVSRIMNGNAELHKPCTVKKVEQAAAELGSVQNLYAQVMQGGRTQSVGMIIDPFTDSFTKDIFSGAHDELMKRDYMPILLLHRDDAHDEKLVKKLASHQVEGLILRPNPNREECSEISMVLDRYNMPVVSVDYALAKTQKYDFVGTADELGGQLAAEHFLEYGHRRMAGFFTPVESLLLRKKGFEEAIKCQPGIAPPLIVTDFEFGSEVPAYHRIKSILSESDAPTAFFVGGDFILPAMYRAANELGLRIPEDLSIIGFGDVDFSQFVCSS